MFKTVCFNQFHLAPFSTVDDPSDQADHAIFESGSNDLHGEPSQHGQAASRNSN